MPKTNRIDEVRAKVKELYDADKEVIITSSLMDMILGYRTSCHVKRLNEEENVLVFKRKVKIGKTRCFEFTVNPDAEWRQKRPFNMQEWASEQKRKEENRQQVGAALHSILFGAWGKREGMSL